MTTPPKPRLSPWGGYELCRCCGRALTLEEREKGGLCEGCGTR